MKAFVFQAQEGAINPLRLPVYGSREEREKAMEQVLIDLSTLKDSKGLYINTAGFVIRIAEIYRQAEDA